ncbi:MAG: Asr1405/Asl0597 family protein [Cyanobacteria bacterium J06648_11]
MNKSAPTWGHTVSVHRCDRWSIHRRLQELKIPSICPADGTLRVRVNHAVALMLVHSVVRRFTLPRQAGVVWLERCWHAQMPCTADR